jgi:hypothetical protein
MAWRGFYLFYPTLMKKKVLSHTEAVYAEIEHIKAVATKSELRRLTVKLLNPLSDYECIYGLMTGDCKSLRAFEITGGLKFKSERIMTSRLSPTTIVYGADHALERKFTPLELHIAEYSQDIRGIVAYLRGRKDVLILSH